MCSVLDVQLCTGRHYGKDIMSKYVPTLKSWIPTVCDQLLSATG